ncbi:hypothetical protein NN561_006393 [Cricetulus griseus]
MRCPEGQFLFSGSFPCCDPLCQIAKPNVTFIEIEQTVSSPSWCQSSDTAFPKASNGAPFPWNNVRLPEHIIPIHYDLMIHANLSTLTFWGTTEVEITVNQPTSTIIMHSHQLQISKATLRRGAEDKQSEEPLSILEYPANEQVALLAPQPLLAGPLYTVIITYAANLSESFHGFYKSTYRTQEGEIRVLASTQFEPTAARMAFPCFDEPALKASFSIKIRRDPRHLAISNMPLVKSVNVAEGLIEDHFDVTVKMSTYLVAFIVCDFKSVSKMTKSGVKVSVYAVPDKINQADYALDAAVTLLEFYEDYFSIPYPLPKQDVLILPEAVEWIKFNVGMNGYYIVHYEDDGWDSLSGLLKIAHTTISSNDRASLINNAFQLVSIGKLSIEKALDLTLYLKDETEIMPVFQGLNELIPMYKLMEKRDMNEVETQFKAFLLRLLKDLIDKQIWTDEGSVSQRMLRSQLLLLACVRKYQPCVQRAEGYFREWKASNGTMSLPVDVTMAVFAVGAQNTEGWDFLYSKYQSSLSVTEKSQIEFALCTSQDPEKLQWFELGSTTISYMVLGTTDQFSTRARLEEVKGFFSSLKENGSQLRCVQQTIEAIEENIRWMEKNFEKIRLWLQKEKLEI